MQRPGRLILSLLVLTGCLLVSGFGEAREIHHFQIQPRTLPPTTFAAPSDRLPDPGIISLQDNKIRTRRTGKTATSPHPLQAPMRQVDLTALTKQAGVADGTASILTPELKAAIAEFQDPYYMRGKRPPTPDNEIIPRAQSQKGLAPWTADHLLANPTDMNDEYVSLERDPLSGFLFAVFAATDLGGTDRDIHISRSMDQGRTWTTWEMPSFAGDEYHPELAIDGGGYIHVVWIRDDGFLIRTRSNYPSDPTSWSAVMGFEVGEPLATPAIAVSGAGAYAKVFIALGWYTVNWDWLQNEWTLLFLYSSNGGQTVSYDYFLPDGYEDLWPDVGMDDGIVHFINAEADPYTGEIEILIATDTYDGCFCNPGSLTGWTINNTGFPRLVCQGDDVFITFQLDYSDGLNVDGDIIYIYSWDAGATFFGPYGMIADEYESVGPAIMANNGIVGCLWLDGPPGADEFYLAGRLGSGFGDIGMFGGVDQVSDQPRLEPQFHSCAGVAAPAGAAAAWIDRRDYPTQGHNVYTSRRGLSPDLSPFVPSGWDSTITAAMTRGGRTAQWLAAGDTTFVSFAFVNSGLADIDTTFAMDLDLDGTVVATWELTGNMPAGSYFPLEDFPLVMAAGAHTLTVRLDTAGNVQESDETNNVFSRTLTWIAGEPQLRLEPASFIKTIIPDQALLKGLVANPPLRREVHLPVIGTRLENAMTKTADSARLRVVIVPAERLDPTALAAALKSVDQGTRRSTILAAARKVIAQHRRKIDPVLDDLVRRGIANPARSYWLAQVSVAEMTPAAIAVLAQNPDVGRLWLDNRKSETFGRVATGSGGLKSSGADKALAWHLQTIGAPQAWDAGYQGDGILVGHIDSGIGYDHPDLYQHMWDGGQEFPNHGFDALDPDNDPYDGDLDWHHGTHTAGLIVSDGTGGTACGDAPGAVLMALRAVPGYFEDLVEAQQFGLDHGVQIFSMSAGWSNAPDDVRAANRYNSELFLSVGIPLIAAAGNGDGYGGHYAVPTDIASPGDCPNPWFSQGGGSGSVITVGAIRQDLGISSTSSIGPTAWNVTNSYSEANYRDYPYPPGLQKPDVTAPGENILSCSGDYGYVAYSGTSMACPLVTGAACILMQANPGITPAQVAEILESTATDITTAPASAGRDAYSGAGLINIPAALALTPTPAGDPIWIHNDGSLPLTIEEAFESASWLGVTAPVSAIAPGDSAVMELNFDTASAMPGVNTTEVIIISNDPDTPHFLSVTLAYGEDISGVDELPTPGLAGLSGYPNPFNPRTVLHFEVAKAGRINLEIYDVRGHLIRRLVAGPSAAGRHEIVWNGQDQAGRTVPSGTYLARLQSDAGQAVTRKLMLVR